MFTRIRNLFAKTVTVESVRAELANIASSCVRSSVLKENTIHSPGALKVPGLAPLDTLSNITTKENIMSTIIRTIAIAFLIATMCYLSTACATYDGIDASGPVRSFLGEQCGWHGDVDKGQCAIGLECFGVCTFECGMKYNDKGDYGLDQASLDRCTTIGGSCDEYKTVGINVCQVFK